LFFLASLPALLFLHNSFVSYIASFFLKHHFLLLFCHSYTLPFFPSAFYILFRLFSFASHYTIFFFFYCFLVSLSPTSFFLSYFFSLVYFHFLSSFPHFTSLFFSFILNDKDILFLLSSLLLYFIPLYILFSALLLLFLPLLLLFHAFYTLFLCSFLPFFCYSMLTFLCPPSQFHLGMPVYSRLHRRKLLFANWNALQLRGSREVSPVAWRNFFVAHCYRSLLLFAGRLTSWPRIDFIARFCMPRQSIGYDDTQKAHWRPGWSSRAGQAHFFKAVTRKLENRFDRISQECQIMNVLFCVLNAQCISIVVKSKRCPTFNWFLELNVNPINQFSFILWYMLSIR